MLQQSSFEQQSLSCIQDFSQTTQSKALLSKHLDIIKELADSHQLAQSLINSYHSFLLSSQFYRQPDLPQQQKQDRPGQIQFLKSIDEPQPSQNTHPIYSALPSQAATPQAFYPNSKNNTPLLNKPKQSQTPSAKLRFVNVQPFLIYFSPRSNPATTNSTKT